MNNPVFGVQWLVDGSQAPSLLLAIGMCSTGRACSDAPTPAHMHKSHTHTHTHAKKRNLKYKHKAALQLLSAMSPRCPGSAAPLPRQGHGAVSAGGIGCYICYINAKQFRNDFLACSNTRKKGHAYLLYPAAIPWLHLLSEHLRSPLEDSDIGRQSM